MLGATAIICGTPAPKQCAFCTARSTKLCDWPVERQKQVPAKSLKADDRIFPFSSGREARTLISVERRDEWVVVTWIWNGIEAQPLRIGVEGNARLAVKGTCDQPCCDAHHRSVGEDVDYCMEHWKVEEIA
jgi:hypothetical protein